MSGSTPSPNEPGGSPAGPGTAGESDGPASRGEGAAAPPSTAVESPPEPVSPATSPSSSGNPAAPDSATSADNGTALPHHPDPDGETAQGATETAGDARKPAGLGQPGPDATRGSGRPSRPGYSHPVPPRNRARVWIGITSGIIVLAVIIAGASYYILHLHREKKWSLTAPQTVAGLSRDTSSLEEASFRSAITQFKDDITRLPHYGTLTSTVSALYTLNSTQAVGFIGFNGTFTIRIASDTENGLTVSSVSPGPHGGTAACGNSGTDAICQWATGTTVGIVVIIPTNAAAGSASAATASRLMLQVRSAAEHSAH